MFFPAMIFLWKPVIYLTKILLECIICVKFCAMQYFGDTLEILHSAHTLMITSTATIA